MENKSQNKILSEFTVPSYEEWLQLVEKQLKGVPFDKKLVTKTADGLTIQPIYLKADAETKRLPVPGTYPFKRGAKATGALSKGWQIAQQFSYPGSKEFNKAVSYDLQRGLTSVWITLDEPGRNGFDPDSGEASKIGIGGLSLSSMDDLIAAFNGVDLASVDLQINPGFSYLATLALLGGYIKKQNLNLNALSGGLISDPIVQAVQQGKYLTSLPNLLDELAACVKWASQNTPKFRAVGIDLRPYNHAGAGAVQELAIALATGVEYLKELSERGCDIDVVAQNMGFYFAVDSDFFVNIAKIRAVRSLWANVIAACEGTAASQKMMIHASTATCNKTVYDPHVNLLRVTTEAYAAVLAGCDTVSVAPFDELMGLSDDFSRRISRNIQIILKEECHGHRIIDPGGGSWYLESLTDQLSSKAWALFQSIEQQGGISKALQKGSIQSEIEKVANQKKADLAKRKHVIVGTTMYANQLETPPTKKPFDYEAFGKQRSKEVASYKSSQGSNTYKINGSVNSSTLFDELTTLVEQGATLGQITESLGRAAESTSITPLKIERLSSEYEALRKNAADYKNIHGEWPSIFLVNMGPLKQHKARADFTTGFVQPGGLETIMGEGLQTVEEAVAATLASKSNIAVICSTDDTYPELVPAIAKEVKANKPDIYLVLAGYPKEHIDSFKEAGIDDFIHLKADNLALLKKFQEKAGV